LVYCMNQPEVSPPLANHRWTAATMRTSHRIAHLFAVNRHSNNDYW
jgi:hypothetical protein